MRPAERGGSGRLVASAELDDVRALVAAAKRRLARVNSRDARIPSIGAVYRHFAPSASGAPDAWRRAVASAALSDDDLRDAYARRMKLDQPS